MKDEDVKIGMKVVAHQKTAGKFPNDHHTFLYVIDQDTDLDENTVWVLNGDSNSIAGGFYNAEDFEPYIEPLYEKVSEEKIIVVQWDRNNYGGSILKIIQSNSDFFKVNSCIELDYGPMLVASMEGYTVIIKPMEDKGEVKL